jgi:cell division septum initiation protein DivIVA
MAKALLGHVGGPDLRLVDEMRRLQQRVRDLEAELLRLRSENDALSAAVQEAQAEELLTLPQQQPAYS